MCDDSFDMNDARVVCRQLGYPTAYVYAVSNAYFGQGYGSIAMDDLGCYGYESNIGQCPHTTNHNCGHHEDVGVVCSNSPWSPGPISDPQLPPTTDPKLPPTTEPKLPPTTDPKLPPTTDPKLPPTTDPKLPPTTDPKLPPTTDPKLPPTTSTAKQGACCGIFSDKPKDPEADACGYCNQLAKYNFYCRDHVKPDGTGVDKTKRDCVSFNYTTEAACKASMPNFGGSWADGVNIPCPKDTADTVIYKPPSPPPSPPPVASGASTPNPLIMTLVATVLAGAMLLA